MDVKLKICGLTSLEDSRQALACGAQYLGFNFYRRSPRYIEPEAVREIVGQLPGEVTAVGIFVNEPAPDDVIKILQLGGLQLAQLHGDEDADYCRRVGPERVIKALRAGPGFDARSVLNYPATVAAAILLDAFDANLYGGTGKTANWEIAREIAGWRRIFLAGGLSPDNLAEAMRIVKPYAVDVNSGVERAPGRKDAAQLQRVAQIITEQNGED
ncbi:MAG TPA: phosphoribosylanthranilate isomerase [Blastocatellia bacterium]|nr:phosphoribosylanthranilate isomerase [Blastocatellia bacterium]